MDAPILLQAAESGHIGVIKAVLAQGLNVNARFNGGKTALMGAAANGHLALVQTLLEAGADPNARDMKGRTALQLALANSHKDVAQLLEQAIITSAATVTNATNVTEVSEVTQENKASASISAAEHSAAESLTNPLQNFSGLSPKTENPILVFSNDTGDSFFRRNFRRIAVLTIAGAFIIALAGTLLVYPLIHSKSRVSPDETQAKPQPQNSIETPKQQSTSAPKRGSQQRQRNADTTDASSTKTTAVATPTPKSANRDAEKESGSNSNQISNRTDAGRKANTSENFSIVRDNNTKTDRQAPSLPSVPTKQSDVNRPPVGPTSSQGTTVNTPSVPVTPPTPTPSATPKKKVIQWP